MADKAGQKRRTTLRERLARVRPYRAVVTLVIGMLVGLLFALWAHVWPVTAVGFDGATFNCGSLLSPDSSVSSRVEFPCSSSLLDREVLRLFGLLFAATFGLLLVAFAGRVLWGGGSWSDLRLVNGDTAVRTARRGDRRWIGSTIDSVVTDEMGWSPKHVENVCRTVGKGWRSGVFIVTESVADRPIGAIPIAAHGGPEGGVSLGAWIGPLQRHQGRMTRAISSVSDFWNNRGLPIFAESAPTNAAAQLILTGAGFTVVGQRRVRLPNGTEIDGTIHARFPDNWSADAAPRAPRVRMAAIVLGLVAAFIVGAVFWR